jgi:methylenetetrahydrofolate dehydrogenase (NADP+)/methenyltetrahydrofolate cyclohydrolase
MTVTMLIENTLRSAERFANGEAFHPPQPFWQVPAR